MRGSSRQVEADGHVLILPHPALLDELEWRRDFAERNWPILHVQFWRGVALAGRLDREPRTGERRVERHAVRFAADAGKSARDPVASDVAQFHPDQAVVAGVQALDHF